MAAQFTIPPESRISVQRRASLLEAAGALSVESEAVLRSELDPAQAVLDEARTRDADLIVVGTRGRSWLERLLTSSVSEQIINRARRSVLVAPVPARPCARSQSTSPTERTSPENGEELVADDSPPPRAGKVAHTRSSSPPDQGWEAIFSCGASLSRRVSASPLARVSHSFCVG